MILSRGRQDPGEVATPEAGIERQCPAAGSGQDVAELGTAKPGVDRNRDRAQPCKGEIEPEPFRRVGQPDGHAIACADAEDGKRARNTPALLRQRAVADDPVAGDECRSPLRGGVKQSADRGRKMSHAPSMEAGIRSAKCSMSRPRPWVPRGWHAVSSLWLAKTFSGPAGT
jgi:hypothetical protein